MSDVRATPAPGPVASSPPGGRSSHDLYVWLFLLGLAANLFSGHSHRIGLPVPPDRLLLPLALYLLWRDPARPRARWGAVGLLMAAFVLWTFISMIWYGNLLSTPYLFAVLDRTILPFVMFLVGPLIFSTAARRDLLLKALTVIGGYLVLTALVEQWAPHLVLPRYIVNPDVGLHFGRVRGPFAESEAMSLTLAVCAGAALLLAGRRLPVWSRLGLVVSPLAMFCVVLTTTRSVWVGTFVGVLVALALSPALRRWIPALVAAAVAGAAAVVVLLPSLLSGILERATSTAPIYDRLSSNTAALRLLADRPLTGIGWRRFYPHGTEWARQSDNFPMNNADIEVHNVLLSRAAELGLPALVVLLLVIALGPVRSALPRPPVPGHGDLPGWRVLSGYVVAVWLVAGMFGPQANPLPNYTVWLIAGVASWGLICSSGGGGGDQLAEPSPGRRPGAHRAPFAWRYTGADRR